MIIKQSRVVLIAMAEALGIYNKTKYDLPGLVFSQQGQSMNII